MLYINSLKLRHFMCCTSADLEFKDSRIVVLNGENGSGKSSALDAIAICLCEHKRADKYNDFVQKGFNEATIEMHALLNNDPLIFNIKMHYSKGAALERDIEYKGKHYINSEATPLLQELDLPFYSTIIFSMQGDADVASMSPTARAIFLQKLLQFDFEKQLSSLKKSIEDYESKKEYNNNQIEFIENSLKSKIMRKPEELPFTEVEKDEKHKKSIVYTRQLSIRSLLYEEKDKLIDTQRELLDKIAKREKSFAIYEQWETSNKLLEKEVETSKKELEAFEVNLDLDSYNIQIESLASQINKIPEIWKKATENRNISVRKIAELESQKKLLQDKNELLKAGKCPHCGQSTSFLKEEHIDEALEDISKEIVKNTEMIKSFDEEISQCQKDTQSLSDNLSKLQTEKSQKELSLKNLKSLVESNIKRLNDSTENAPKNVPLQDYLEVSLAEVNKQLNETNQKIATYSSIEKELSSITNDLTKYNEIEKRNIWILEENEKIKNEISKNKLEIENLKKENIEATKQQGFYIEAKKIIDSELPNFLIVKTCGKLEQEMNDFIQVVFPTMKVRLFQNKKGVEFFYTRDEKADTASKASLINTKMASGFEKSLLSIAFKVALCRAYNLSFTVLDEIDAFATDLSSAKIFQSLILSNAFNQIFIITHKPSTREIIQETAENPIFYHVEKGKFTLEEN